MNDQKICTKCKAVFQGYGNTLCDGCCPPDQIFNPPNPMTTKTEEAKIVEAVVPTIEQLQLGEVTFETAMAKIEEALATYKASILSECEKCVPPPIDTRILHECQCGNPIVCTGHNDCRTQTLQAINSLKV